MIDKVEKLCMSCGACYNTCPESTISMEYDEKGFYTPKVNYDNCIECRSCIDVCAAIDYKSTNNDQPLVYAIAAEDNIRKNSTSGGFFPVIAKYVLENNGYVCGVAWNNKWKAEHIIIDKIEDLPKLQYSKYVQSDTNDVFMRIRDLLLDNKLVLFSGAPCQCAGLYKFLVKKYDNLITVDFLCAGNPSPKVWKDYLEENFDISKITDINFRAKYDDWNKGTTYEAVDNINYGYILENGVKKPIGAYYDAFLKYRLYHDGCLQCKYKFIPRPADFTMGDFWYFKDNKKYDSKNGLSVVLVNNSKAEKILSTIKDKFIIYDKINLKGQWWKVEIGDWDKRTRERLEFFKHYEKGGNVTRLMESSVGRKYDVALLTMFNIMNYGSALVAYAVNQMIESLGYTVLMIDKDINGVDYNKTDNRSMQFAKKKYNISKYYKNNESTFELNKIVDTFVVGSDTMWWDTEWAYDYAYLDFVESSKRKIAFTTSFAHETPAMDYNAQIRRKYLFNRFDYISTREESGVKILKEMFGVDSVSFYDPTLMVEKEIFDKLAEESGKTESDFVFAYMLDLTPEKEEAAKYVADKLNAKLKIISNMRYKGKSKYIDENNISIEDFVYYCKNAKFIITDSFHGICFSVIYERPFLAIVNAWRGFARYKRFEEMQLKSQIVDSVEKVYEYKDFNFQIDFTTAKEKIEEERPKVYKWLSHALSAPLEKVSESDLLYDYIYQKHLSYSQGILKRFLGQ